MENISVPRNTHIHILPDKTHFSTMINDEGNKNSVKNKYL